MTIPMLHEVNYAAEMQTIVEPYLARRREPGRFQREPGKPLYYEVYRPEAERGFIVLCHGFCESIPKYNEVIYYFLQAGYAVAAMEHQGHGRSYRRVSENWLTHVERFDDYTEDFTAFLREVVLPLTGEAPVYLFGHSMGGAVAGRVLEQSPSLPISRVVLSSPMIAPSTHGVPGWLALLIARVATALGRGDRCLFNQHEYTGESDFDTDWGCATSHARYEWVRWMVAKRPELQNCSSSYCWLREALLVTDRLLEEAENIAKPVLLMQAGQDTMVELPPQDAFVKKLRDGQKVVFPEAKHEIFRSDDATVERFISTVLTFFETGEVSAR